MGSEITQMMDTLISESLDNHDTLIPLLSGGKDSMTVTDHVYKRFRKYVKHAVFVNTTVSVLATRHFILEQCKKYNWKFQMLYPKVTFKEFVVDRANGFPSTGNHPIVMGFLKYHPMRSWFLESYHRGERPIYVSGVRKNESTRRSANYNSPFVKDGNLEFVASAFNLETVDVWDYVQENNLVRAPAYEILGYGGDCLCGSFSTKEESKLLQQFYTIEWENIKWIESLIPARIADIEKQISIREIEQSKILSWKKKRERKELQLLYKQRKNLKTFNHWGNSSSTQDIELQGTLDQFQLAQDMICGTDGCQMFKDRIN